jgi:hypothetical protein
VCLERGLRRRAQAGALGKASRGRVSHRQISPIKSGPQPIVAAQGRICGRRSTAVPLSAIGSSHLGNPVCNVRE